MKIKKEDYQNETLDFGSHFDEIQAAIAFDLLAHNLEGGCINLCVTESFWECAIKLVETPDKLVKLTNELPESGMYHIIAPKGMHYYFYYELNDFFCTQSWCFYKQKLMQCVGVDEHGKNDYADFLSDYDVALLCIILMYKFAEVETVLLNKIAKRGKLGKEKYINETSMDITLLDSLWFRTIVQSEGFRVRGHFAIRAFGEGRSQRKLVWISEYQKSGYSREAGILKQ